MAQTKIREQQVLDSDFSSEAETLEQINLHLSNTVHPPAATPTELGKYLRYTDTGYIWDVAITGEGENGLPVQTDNAGKFLSTNGITSSWETVLKDGWKSDSINLYGGSGGDNASPLWGDVGNGMWGWYFSDEHTNTLYGEYDIKLDFIPGTRLYPVLHWMPLNYSTGTAKWRIEYIIREPGGILATEMTFFDFLTPCSGNYGEHFFYIPSEIQAPVINSRNTTIRFKISRMGGDLEDTLYGPASIFQLSFFYRTNLFTTETNI